MICNECETVSYCTKHGCIPKHPAPVQVPKFWYDEEIGELYSPGDDRPDGCIPLYHTPLAQPAVPLTDEREQGQKWFDAVTAQHKQLILAEREACAKVCDEQVERSMAAIEKSKRTTDHTVYRSGAQTAKWNAAAIRARGTHD